MKKVIMFSLLLAVTSDVSAFPTLIEASATGTTFKFATKLSEKLPTGYKLKIDLNNGKGFVAMNCSGLACSLSSNALPKLDSLTYKIGIYDAKGVLQGATMDGSYVIVSTAEINIIPISTTGYTKISNSGAVLPDTATLGSGANDWACTKDNKTGLTWEVKTDDGGLRHIFWVYSWYKPSGDNGGDVGYTDIDKSLGAPKCSTEDNCNTDVFTKAVNTKGLCGKKDWRMPTKAELMKLVVCSDGKYAKNGSCTNGGLIVPTINSTYFPDTWSNWYWSSSPYAPLSSNAQGVNFYYGYSGSFNKDSKVFVRLVR
jgi:hypothetical protein